MSCPTSFNYRNPIKNQQARGSAIIAHIQFNQALNCIAQQQNTLKTAKTDIGLHKQTEFKSKYHSNYLLTRTSSHKNNYKLSQISVRYKNEIKHGLPKYIISETIQKKYFKASFKLKKKSKKQKLREQLKQRYIKTPNLQRSQFSRLIQRIKRSDQVPSLSVQQVMINRFKQKKQKDYFHAVKSPLNVLCQYKRQIGKIKGDFNRLMSK